MKKLWDDEAWEDYLYWQSQDRKTLKRINTLLKDIDRNGNDGLGKPEPLRYGLDGYWSRRIDEKNRLVYFSLLRCDFPSFSASQTQKINCIDSKNQQLNDKDPGYTIQKPNLLFFELHKSFYSPNFRFVAWFLYPFLR